MMGILPLVLKTEKRILGDISPAVVLKMYRGLYMDRKVEMTHLLWADLAIVGAAIGDRNYKRDDT